MSYAPTTDLLGLLRKTAGGVRVVRMPGLDYLVAGLSRANLFALWVGATAPVANQATTVWLKPGNPDWDAEGSVFLFNVGAQDYETATPALWTALLVAAASGVVFQSVAGASAVVSNNTTLLAVRRVAPVATTLILPPVAVRNGRSLQIVDWSTAVANHQITVDAAGGETIMQSAALTLLSTADQFAGTTLYPSTDLSGWVIAP